MFEFIKGIKGRKTEEQEEVVNNKEVIEDNEKDEEKNKLDEELKEYKEYYEKEKVNVSEEMPYELFEKEVRNFDENGYLPYVRRKVFVRGEMPKEVGVSLIYIEVAKSKLEDKIKDFQTLNLYKEILNSTRGTGMVFRKMREDEPFTTDDLIEEIDNLIQEDLKMAEEYRGKVKTGMDKYFENLREEIGKGTEEDETVQHLSNDLEDIYQTVYDKLVKHIRLDVERDNFHEDGVLEDSKYYIEESIYYFFFLEVIYLYVKKWHNKKYTESVRPYLLNTEEFYREVVRIILFRDFEDEQKQIKGTANLGSYKRKEIPDIKDVGVNEWFYLIDNYVNVRFNKYLTNKIRSGEYIYSNGNLNN